jgi:hypothetical protein
MTYTRLVLSRNKGIIQKQVRQSKEAFDKLTPQEVHKVLAPNGYPRLSDKPKMTTRALVQLSGIEFSKREKRL